MPTRVPSTRQNHQPIAHTAVLLAVVLVLWPLLLQNDSFAGATGGTVDEPYYLQQPVGQPHLYLVRGGKRQHIPDPATLTRLGLAERDVELWPQTQINSLTEIEALPTLTSDTGRLIKATDRPEIYWHDQVTGRKHHIPDEQSFRDYRFDFKQVEEISPREANQIPSGLALPSARLLRLDPAGGIDPRTKRTDLPPEILKLISASTEAVINRELADFEVNETHETKQKKWAEAGPLKTIIAEWTQAISYQVTTNGPAKFALTSASIGRNISMQRIEVNVEAEIDVPIKFAAQGKVKDILGTSAGIAGDTKGETVLSANVAIVIRYDLRTKQVSISVPRLGTKVHKITFNSELMNLFADVFRGDLQRTANEKLANAATRETIQTALQANIPSAIETIANWLP